MALRHHIFIKIVKVLALFKKLIKKIHKIVYDSNCLTLILKLNKIIKYLVNLGRQ